MGGMARLGEMCLADVELPIGFKSILVKAPMCPSLLAGGGWTRDVLNPIQPGLMGLCPCCHSRFREKNSKIKGVEGKKDPWVTLWVEGQTSPGGSRCPRGTGAIRASVSTAARRDECPVSSKHLKMHQGPQKEVAAPAAAPGPSRPQPAPDLPKPKMPKQVRPVRDVLHKQEGSEILCIGGEGGGGGGEEEGNLPANEISLFPACVGRQQWVAWLTPPRSLHFLQGTGLSDGCNFSSFFPQILLRIYFVNLIELH